MGRTTNLFYKLVFILICLFVILFSIAVFRALILFEDPVLDPCDSTDKDFISDSQGLSKRLSQAIQFQTISHSKHDYNRRQLKDFADFIIKSFPLVHSSSLVKKEVVNNYSLLYHVRGSNNALKPYLLAGHMDVVPVEESYWIEKPFSGIIKDGYIWGRGTIDCKHIVMGILEALEFLLKNGFKPKRSFYLAFGHDEEVHGLDGAQHISKLLKSRNVELEYILDEGSFVFDDFIPGIKSPVGFVSVTEKGSIDIELKARSIPGHSSFPSKETAIVILAKAIAKLEGDIFPSMLGKGPEVKLFEELAYCAPLPLKIVFRNLWLFKSAIIMYMTKPMMSAMHKTTVAVTIISGGTKINVLPSEASANINLRVHPAQSIAEAVQYLKDIMNDDRIEINILHQTEPHPISPIDVFGYSKIRKSIRQIYNDSCVVPITLIANTDTKWYLELSPNIYRFSLVRLRPNETSRFHGHNERIGVDNYVQVVNFYLHLIKNSDETDINKKHNHSEL